MTDPQFKPLTQADIHWDQNGVPFSSTFDDLYFSQLSGIDETNHVFIHHNQLPERWKKQPVTDFTIGETGFGTGLNFLVTADLWLRETSQGVLHYISAEKYPLSQASLTKAYKHWPQFAYLTEALLQQIPPPVTGIHRLSMAAGRVVLTLLWGDAEQQFSALKGSDHPYFQRSQNPLINAWFLDGFAPAKNPGMWTDTLFQCMADLSAYGTTFSTFTAAGAVRRGLQKTGFKVSKVAGFGNKREMLAGAMIEPASVAPTEQQSEPSRFNSPYQPPWYLCQTAKNIPQTAIVIGGGIAGCTTAYAMAERGIKVTLIERHSQLAQEGSGNPQAIIYPKLSIKNSPLASFSLAALINACRYYLPFWRDKKQRFGRQSGVVVIPGNTHEKETFSAIAKQFPAEIVRLLNTRQLNQTTGIALANNVGLYFAGAGWINPETICNALSNHPNITLRQGEVASTDYNGFWQVSDTQGKSLAEADALVIACGANANQFTATQHLALKTIRGQISYLPATEESARLKTVICGEGYIAPAKNGIHCLGATYTLNVTSPAPSSADHRQNIQQLTQTDTALGNHFDAHPAENLQGRVAFRCTTPDYLPIAGAVPHLEKFLSSYELLKKNARAHIPISGSYWPNLYINCGHGSRGMTYAPLCADVIASQITHQAPPLELNLRRAIHPGRFIIRGLKRGNPPA